MTDFATYEDDRTPQANALLNRGPVVQLSEKSPYRAARWDQIDHIFEQSRVEELDSEAREYLPRP